MALNAVNDKGKVLAEFGENYTPDFMPELAADVQKIREANPRRKFKLVKVAVNGTQISKRYKKSPYDYKI